MDIKLVIYYKVHLIFIFTFYIVVYFYVCSFSTPYKSIRQLVPTTWITLANNESTNPVWLENMIVNNTETGHQSLMMTDLVNVTEDYPLGDRCRKPTRYFVQDYYVFVFGHFLHFIHNYHNLRL